MLNTTCPHRSFKGIGLVFLLAGCTSATGPSGDISASVHDSGAVNAQSLYEMPTPNELFQIVREISGEGQRQMMSPAVNLTHYNTKSKRALNFGVYATDLVFASSFNLTSEVARYFIVCKKLGDDLGLAGSFNDSDLARLQRNLTKGDSLDVISDEAYKQAYRRMREEDMGPVLSLVLAGGWVESMHLVTHQVIHFDPQNALVQRVAEQKVSLNHLVDLMGAYPTDPEVLNMKSRLLAIRDIYDTFPVVREPHKGISPSGRAILGDDIQILATPEGFQLLSNALEALREDIIRPEDAPKAANA